MLRNSELKGRNISSPSLPLSGWHWDRVVIHVGPQEWKPRAGDDKAKQGSGPAEFHSAEAPRTLNESASNLHSSLVYCSFESLFHTPEAIF